MGQWVSVYAGVSIEQQERGFFWLYRRATRMALRAFLCCACRERERGAVREVYCASQVQTLLEARLRAPPNVDGLMKRVCGSNRSAITSYWLRAAGTKFADFCKAMG